MILLYTLAILSIVVMGGIVMVLLFVKPKPNWVRFLLFLYIYNFLSDLCLVYTALNGIRNHFIANTHVLLFGLGMLVLLGYIWERLLKKKLSSILILVLSIVYIAAWIIDGFVLHEINTFNPFGQTFIYIFNLCIVIYLLNVLLFSKEKGVSITIDRYLIYAFLVHCFGAIIIDSFFNYYITLPKEIYRFTHVLGLALGVLTNLLVFLAVIWISRAQKYTLR